MFRNGYEIDCQKIPLAFRCANGELVEGCNFNVFCEDYQNLTSGAKIQLTVLFASFCSHSQKFIIETLYPKVYQNFKDYVDIELVPFGNANRTEVSFPFKFVSNSACSGRKDQLQARRGRVPGSFDDHLRTETPKRCHSFRILLRKELQTSKKQQRDRWEMLWTNWNCGGNTNQARVGYVMLGPSPGWSENFYERVKHFDRDQYSKHSGIQRIDRVFRQCAISEEGYELQQADANRTENAWPDWAESAPWIVINNLSLKIFQQIDLVRVLCDFYLTAADRPEICQRWNFDRVLIHYAI